MKQDWKGKLGPESDTQLYLYATLRTVFFCWAKLNHRMLLSTPPHLETIASRQASLLYKTNKYFQIKKNNTYRLPLPPSLHATKRIGIYHIDIMHVHAASKLVL
jgi:hypothetical protein